MLEASTLSRGAPFYRRQLPSTTTRTVGSTATNCNRIKFIHLSNCYTCSSLSLSPSPSLSLSLAVNRWPLRKSAGAGAQKNALRASSFTFFASCTHWSISTGSQQFCRNGCLRRSLATGRSSGSSCRHWLRNSCMSVDHRSGSFRPGMPFVVIKNSALSGGKSIYGGSPSASSMSRMPRLQMSTCWSYSEPRMSSGAIQYGVPTIVCLLVLPLDSCAAYPKSAILTMPSPPTRTLSLLMSLWMRWHSWMYWRPSSTSLQTNAICRSVIFSASCCSSTSVRQPPSISSITTQILSSTT
mmetsp:Transcript_3497/g.12327  ORF Transcript_3497/g.12327 Transcript_3497/m.12327 type:complete len:297 (+) Transcript_3497:1378-2268(+)